uniref:Prohibitin n=1 Tax=Sinocyclocheilus anshuiensis TaxID=1608454 RepID=A0A671T9S6_9TELE
MANKEPNRLLQNLKDLAGRMSSGSKGAGLGLKLLIGAGALAYGVKEATYTGNSFIKILFFKEITLIQQGCIKLIKSDSIDIYNVRKLSNSNKHSSKNPEKMVQLFATLILKINCASSILKPTNRHCFTIFSTDFMQVSLLIRRELFERAKDFNIILDDVAITELSFSKEYTAAVEAKQVAQQEAQRAQFFVEKAKQEQRQKIIQAEGEAQAAKMLGEAVTKNPGYLKLRRIRAAQNIAKTVAASQNRVYLSADSLVLNLQDDSFNKLSLGKK